MNDATMTGNVGNNLLSLLATTVPRISAETASEIELTLRDFIAGVLSGSTKYPSPMRRSISADANYLALTGSSDDLDDVDWDVLTHPGSIIWPVLLAAYLENGNDFEKLQEAAYFGYRAGRSIAKLLGVSHRNNWHLTTTSGAFAATSALARYWDLPQDQHIAALKMVLTTMTGSPLAGFERAGATQFNRAVATSLAITAVTSAQIDAPYIHDIWEGPRGVVAMYNAEESALQPFDSTFEKKFLLDGISSLHIRTYFATGFASSAIEGILNLMEENGTPDSITVTLSSGLSGVLDGSRGGTWWSPELIVRSLIANKDPFKIVDSEPWPGKVNIVFGDVAPGAAKIDANYGSRTISRQVDTPPFKVSELSGNEIELIHEKWRRLAGIDNFSEIPILELLNKLLL